MNMRFYIYSCTLICMKRSEAIDQLREMDAKYSCYVYCKNEAGIDPRFADALLQRGEAPIEAVFSAADALGIDIAALPLSSLGNTR